MSVEANIRYKFAKGQDIKKAAEQLSDERLAVKMECHVSQIIRAKNNMPVYPSSGLTPSDCILIRQCAAERRELMIEQVRYTAPALAHEYNKTLDEVNAIVGVMYASKQQ